MPAKSHPEVIVQAMYEKWTSGSSGRNYFESEVAFDLLRIQDLPGASTNYNDPADVRVVAEQRRSFGIGAV
jgi:hypothetical protein